MIEPEVAEDERGRRGRRPSEDAPDEDAEAVDPWEQVDGADGEPEAELAERGGIFRRRRR